MAGSAAMPELVFLDLDDTPMFKSRVHDLEGSAKKLKERCSLLLSGAKKYRDAIAAMHDAHLAFSGTLQEFGGGTDEESLLLGSALMGQFIKTFKELATYYDFLKTQVEVGLVERLQREWVDGTLSSAREEQRRYEKRASEHEAMRARYLGLKKLTKRDVLDRSLADLSTSKHEADEARYAVARALSEVEGGKRYAFLELVVGAVHAQLKFFQAGGESLKALEGPVNNALQIVEHLRREDTARAKQLEDMVRQHRDVSTAREALITATNHGLGADAAGDPSSSPSAAAAAVAASGPVQMSSRQAVLLGEIERLIRATQESGGQQVTIIRRGHLHKRSQGKKDQWKQRFFVLDSQGMLYYYSHKADNLINLSRTARPKNTVNLLTSTIKLDAEDSAMRCCFRVVSPEGTYTLQAENDLERSEWIDVLQGVINCLLNGSVSPGGMPRVPARPTHSRHTSFATELSSIDGGSVTGGLGDNRGSGSQPGTPYGTPDGSLVGDEAVGTSYRASVDGGFGVSGSSPSFSGGASSRLARSSLGVSGPPPTLERLRKVPGNRFCADCSAADPDWASLNLGVLLCIECSGVHRQVGVHISKVRSCTLDVKVWEQHVLEVFEAIGNEASNAVWEAHLSERAMRKGDAWVWCDESDDEPGATAGAAAGGAAATATASGAVGASGDGDRRQRRSGSGGGAAVAAGGAAAGSGGGALESGGKQRSMKQQQLLVEDETLTTCVCKPSPNAPLPDKQKFIQEKYVARGFVAPLPREQAQALLWDAVDAGDIRLALRALASGADVNASYRTPRAQRLVREASMRQAAVTGAAETPESPRACGDVTVLHAAAAVGWAPLLEFLLQNGANWEHLDANGLSPLHYAMLHDHSGCAKLLLRRGADSQQWRDGRGRQWSALDFAMQKGRISDDEMLVLLSRGS